MNQGNIGLFKNDAGRYRWLWKVHRPGDVSGKVEYMDMITGEILPALDVTDNLNNGCAKDWMIEYELSPEEALKRITFAPGNPEQFKRQLTAEQLCRKKAELEKKLDNARRKMVESLAEWENWKKKRDELTRAVMDVQAEIDALDDENRELYLVHASHSAADEVDYCWRADKELAEKLEPGDLISVDTAKGTQLAIVRKVEATRNWADHKKVIALVRKGGD